ncbi:MAG: DUF6607 family protein [Pacificimonas sp.]|jgi:hypothetical protein|nr:DUF6607 family protein [Pacificimonas sp.]
MMTLSVRLFLFTAAFTLLFGAVAASAQSDMVGKSAFERDREAILAMAGNYRVTFDFRETAAFTEGYELKDPYRSGGHEIVRVIEDRGDFISLQHILVVGGDQKFPIKHWRQDWRYEPEEVLVFIGGNAWERRAVSEEERHGRWSQTVYQVDDAPRYGAVGAWSHDNGLSEWQPPAEWRPLPRRDMTTRDDYHAMDAVNRHALTPTGWVHEQDNAKVVLDGTPHVLTREIGVNTYQRYDGFETSVGDDYWNATKDYWAGVRAIWDERIAAAPRLALTEKGEAEGLYMSLLGLGTAVEEGTETVEDAVAEARTVIETMTTLDLPPLASRLREPAGDTSGN